MKLQMNKKRLLIAGMAGLMTAASVFPAFAAGFTQENGKTYYYYDNGQKATGLLQLADKYYYFLDDGSMVTGWLRLDNDYYYMQADGSLSTGWVTIDNEKYYMRPDSGKCVLNEAVEIDGFWYFFKGDGKQLTGWLKKDGDWYYLDPSNEGRLIANTTKTIDGVSYSFGPSGICNSAVSVSNFYETNTTQAQESTEAESTTSEEDDNYGKTNVIVAGHTWED